VPVLSPRSPVPITVKFQGASLQKVFETLSKLSGVNILFDEGFRDKNVDFAVTGITFEEALDQLTFTNRYFYKVLDQNTIIIVPESLQKHRDYDDNLVQTFYLQNADATEMAALITNWSDSSSRISASLATTRACGKRWVYSFNRSGSLA
jgi:general secretion pathway protein D